MDGSERGDGFSAAEMGALAHLYRAEVYRSTLWRTRLDNTTNWSVVTLGIALSLSYSSPEATALPLILVGLLAALFLGLEARRYRYFNVWRARCRLMETDFYAPMLRGAGGGPRDGRWNALLADDLMRPRFHITYLSALGRRLRKNYFWIFVVQLVAYAGKIAIHPAPMTDFAQLFERAAIGPAPGWAVLAAGLAFHGFWIVLAVYTWRLDVLRRRRQRTLIAIA